MDIYRKLISCTNCFLNNHVTFMYSSMLARIAMKNIVSNQSVNRRMYSSNKAYMCTYPKLSMFGPTAPRYTLCSPMTGSNY
eukprot:1140750-Pelagomonas_calceolata.AAC.4